MTPRSTRDRPRPLLFALTALLLASGGFPAKADRIVADLTSHLIAIGSGFTGDSVVLFGATDGPGDVIAVVRGPAREMTVWRKEKVAGIWVNAESVSFADVPSFYAVAASRPIEEILAPGAAELYRIGSANLKLARNAYSGGESARRFADALIQQQRQAGLFSTTPFKISFLGQRLFRSTIAFPANVPTGTYLVQVYLVRDRDIVGGQTTPLVVSKVGVDAAVSEFASRDSAAYGAVAVLIALVAGWLASLPFRGV